MKPRSARDHLAPKGGTVRRNEKIVLALLLAVFVQTGCAARNLATQPGDGVVLELEPQEYRVIAAVRGKDCVQTLLGLQLSNPDLLKAELKALDAAPGAEILLNKHVYDQQETVIPLIAGRSCFYIEGLAVKIR